MKLSIAAGAAVLHAASTLTGQTIVTREGALLSFEVHDLDLNDTVGALHGVIEEVRDAILKTENEAEIAGLTDLQRELVGMERDIRIQFQLADAVAGKAVPHVGDNYVLMNPAVVEIVKDAVSAEVGSHPTATGDEAISNAPQQTSEAVNEETEIEPSQPQPKPVRRTRRKRA